MTPEQICLQALSAPNKSKRVKMPHWLRPESRIAANALIPWEVYSNPACLLNEKETIAALQALMLKKVVDIEVSSSSTVWWCLK